MSARQRIGEFLSQRRPGLVGASRGGRRFGNTAHRWIWGVMGRLPT